MGIWHKKKSRKTSGGRYHQSLSKRKSEMGKEPAHTKAADKIKVKKVRTTGGSYKLRALALNYANVLDPKTGKYQKVTIKGVIENKASRHFARMKIVTKGAIIETELGKAKVTNRPGQEGTINAILVD